MSETKKIYERLSDNEIRIHQEFPHLNHYIKICQEGGVGPSKHYYNSKRK
jgi:hypothetical protein